MTYPERPFGEVLTRTYDPVIVEAGGKYDTIGIYSYGRGIIERPTIDGSETKYRVFNRLHAGQFIFSKLFGWEGALAVVRERHEGRCASPEFPTFELDAAQVDFRYLSHLAAWPTLHQRLRGGTTGMGSRRQRISPQKFLATEVPLPDLAEQRRVAARLDVGMVKLARAEELRQSTTHVRNALRESLISKASMVTKRALETVMTLTRRSVEVSASASYREIGLRSFGRGVFHKPPVSGAELGTKKIFRIEPGDLLFSSVFAWEGAVARASAAEMNRVGSHRFMTYVVDPSIADADYLRFYFLSAPGLEILRRCSPGGAGRNRTLGIKPFGAEIIPLPSLSEQQRIARMLLSAEVISRDYGLAFDTQIQAARTAMLNAAFTGEF
ncbi:restriction endonuclease subunit S [Streptomyces sp. NBC_01476]|uniref:restriction endonuclease subunit S n=1 Tax=Streptomyces sp. NBC_01476 TaxID=2903881 RepID=UPI002E35F3C6|nr:restriction endonuclease subunit S [Streptomyces sp. NBC_01476]